MNSNPGNGEKLTLEAKDLPVRGSGLGLRGMIEDGI